MNLLELLRFKPPATFGLDIGSSTIKAVQMQKTDSGYVVSAAGFAEVNNHSTANDEEKRLNNIMAIRQCVQSADIKTQFVVCSLCGEQTAVRDFAFPTLESNEIEGAVRLEAEQTCPFDIAGNRVIDYQLISKDSSSVGLMVMATGEMVDTRAKLAIEAGLQPVIMDINGLAILNCFTQSRIYDPQESVAIMNICGSYTNLVITANGDNAPFIRDVGCGGNDIIERIAFDNNKSVDEITQILFYGYRDSDSENIYSGMADTSSELVGELESTLRYYSAMRKSGSIQKILLCGGFALASRFASYLQNHFSAEVSVWNPFDDFECTSDTHCREIISTQGTAMVVAAGLAMRTI